MPTSRLLQRRLSFTPTDVPDLALWYLAHDTNHLVHGLGFSSWLDRSGWERHATQVGGTQQPTWTRDILRGYAGAKFDGANDLMDFDGSFLVGTPWTAYVVQTWPNPVAGYGYVMGNASATANQNPYFGWKDLDTFTLSQGGGTDLDSATALQDPLGEVWCAVRGTSGRRLYRNGQACGSDSNATLLTAAASMKLGAVPALGVGAGNAYNGMLCELLLYTGDHDDATRHEIEVYLGEKYGLRLEEGSAVAAPSGLLTSLVGYWKLDEASGTRSDSVGTSHLTDVNTVTSNPGKQGNAGQFTAANSEYLSVGDNAALSMGDIDFTVAFWAYADTLSGGYPFMLGKYNEPANQREYSFLYFSGSGRVTFALSSNGAAQTLREASSFGALSPATWYFVVGWHDSVANTINIQVNGGTVDSTAYSVGVHDGTSAFIVGAMGAPAQFWDGRIDEVGIWKKVLSSTERSNLYAAGAGITFPFTGVP